MYMGVCKLENKVIWTLTMCSRKSCSLLCNRCELVYLKYGRGKVIALRPSDNPLREFEVVDASKNVFRFVVFIL